MEVLTSWVSSWVSLLGLQMAIFLLYPFLAFLLHVGISVEGRVAAFSKEDISKLLNPLPERNSILHFHWLGAPKSSETFLNIP